MNILFSFIEYLLGFDLMIMLIFPFWSWVVELLVAHTIKEKLYPYEYLFRVFVACETVCLLILVMGRCSTKPESIMYSF